VENRWGDGTMEVLVDAHLGLVELPDGLATSVRCIVQVGSDIVVCTNGFGRHPWPGRRREQGETFEQPACREVHEETGWVVDPASLRQLGWIRLEYPDEKKDDWPCPHPDFPQVVFAGCATHRDDRQGISWSDTEGFEESSRLVAPSDPGLVFERDDLARVFLEVLA
jgi:ADP-ribose pyrophosphatase YjhB (NUDIX family)